jgi:hypothetical protein
LKPFQLNFALADHCYLLKLCFVYLVHWHTQQKSCVAGAAPAHTCCLPRGCAWQDNFVSHTMKAEEEANLERIKEQKSKSDVTHPLEPLIMSLIKGYVDNQNLSEKIKALYQV